MNHSKTLSVPAPVALRAPTTCLGEPATWQTRAFLALIVVPLLTAATAALQIPTPFGVPMTLQTLVVVLSGVYLGSTWGVVSMGAYMTLGLCGLPFFALGDGTGGLHYLAGMTGGYLLGFPLAAGVVGGLSRMPLVTHATGWSAPMWRFLVLVAGSAVILTLGSLNIAVVHQEPSLAAQQLSLFVPFAVVKAMLGALLWMPARGRRD